MHSMTFAVALLISSSLWAQSVNQIPPQEDDDGPASKSVSPTPPLPKDAPVATQAPKRLPVAEESKPVPPTPPSAPPSNGEPAPNPQTLVSGAPLYNPNVAVHIVEHKDFADVGRSELVLYPATVQVNGKFTNHAGSAASYTYHLQENFALYASPVFNWYSAESSFNQELINKARVEAQAATSLLLVWGAHAGLEVTPLYGKFAFNQAALGHFALVLSGGAGVGGTRHQLKPATPGSTTQSDVDATFGDTGARLLGQVGGGFRVQIGTRFTIRAEVHDLLYTARVDQVNGCNFDDLSALNTVASSGGPLTSAGVSKGCRVSDFSKTSDPRPGINLARNLVQTPSSDVLNNLGFYAGMGFLF